MEKVVVFGGAGFVGSNLVAGLLKANYLVAACDNFSTGKKENLKEVADHKNLTIVDGDIRDLPFLINLLKGNDIVIHAACLLGAVRSFEKPIEVCEVNDLGTLKILEACRLNNIKRIVYVSTSEMYASPPKYVPIDEEHPIKPHSIYASSMLAAENHCQAYNHLYGMNATCIRFFPMYGPNQEKGRFGGAITNFLYNTLIKNEPIEIWGTGTQKRDFLYIGDVVKIILKGLKTEAFWGQIFNCGGEKEMSVKDLANLIYKIIGKEKLLPIFKNAKPGDVQRLVADNKKLKSALGELDLVDVEEGILSYKDWMLKNSVK